MADATTTLADLRMRVFRFVSEREWARFHTPKDLAMALSIEASELLERFLWRDAGLGPPPDPDRRAATEELADVFIYGLSMANALEIDLSEAILAKLAANERRFPAGEFRGRAP